MRKCLSGKILVSSPHLADKNFFKTVVAICDHNEKGAMGFVLNSYMPTKDRLDIQATWSRYFGDCECVDKLYVGGPVSSDMMLLHTDATHSEFLITDGIFLTSDKAKMHDIVDRGDAQYRCFIGYSGWGRNQLEKEMRIASWYVVANSHETMFHDCEPDELWKCQLNKFGADLIQKSCRIPTSAIPQDVRSN